MSMQSLWPTGSAWWVSANARSPGHVQVLARLAHALEEHFLGTCTPRAKSQGPRETCGSHQGRLIACEVDRTAAQVKRGR